jgi:methionyl aminopeptidase
MPVVKTPEQVELMGLSAALLARCLDILEHCAQAGKSGAELDAVAEEFIKDHGAIPAFKNYGRGMAPTPFPATICFSRNSVVVHGVPSEEDIIEDGDIITIDCGLSLNGWFADSARLFGVGDISREDKAIIKASEDTIQAGIDACVVGNKLGDVCYAIQKAAALSDYYNVVQFCGHAIGREMHEAPQVPNFGRARTGLRLKPGMVFCLEPMLKKTQTDLGILPDNWSIVTLDGSRATHIEHMVLVTEDQPEILTK